MTYLPYEKLSVKWASESPHILLDLPWASLEIEVEEEEKEWIMTALENVHQNPEHPYVQKFLNHLEDYPLSYIKPRSKDDVKEDDKPLHKVFLSDLNYENPRAFLKSFDQGVPGNILDETPQEWQWSLPEVLEKTKIDGLELYDPLSVVTYLIGKRLEIENETASLRTNLPLELDRLRQNDEEQFFEIMKIIIRQTHYITSHFEECCYPALKNFEQANTLIKKFMDEEVNHDKFMATSLKELNCQEPHLINVLDAFTFIMKLFKHASETSPLAFTLMIGYFEGISFEETDPLADVLQNSSRPLAAKGFIMHHDINVRSHHTNMIFELAQFLFLLKKEEIEFAMRLLETVTSLGIASDQYLYKLSVDQEEYLIDTKKILQPNFMSYNTYINL